MMDVDYPRPVNVCIPVKVFNRIADENTRADASTRVYVGLLILAHERASDELEVSLEEVARAARVTKRTVSRAIPILEKIGAIKKVRAQRATDTNSYRLVGPDEMA